MLRVYIHPHIKTKYTVQFLFVPCELFVTVSDTVALTIDVVDMKTGKKNTINVLLKQFILYYVEVCKTKYIAYSNQC